MVIPDGTAAGKNATCYRIDQLALVGLVARRLGEAGVRVLVSPTPIAGKRDPQHSVPGAVGAATILGFSAHRLVRQRLPTARTLAS